jgi:predicted RNase H-like HicB family nuclease
MENIDYKNQTFPVILEEDETGGYIVINPAIEGCYSQGETTEEALKNIKEATELCLEEAKGESDKIKIKNISLHLINLKNKYV